MYAADAAVGKVVLCVTSVVFVALVFWVNTYPFVDEELSIYSYIPDPQWALLFCACFGFVFIGGLMSYTAYHLFTK